MSSLLTKSTGVKTYQMVVNVTGFLEGELSDWPANIQDKILEALEAKAQEVEHPLTVVYSACGKDWGSDDSNPKFFLHVIASEIVVADSRMFEEEKFRIRTIISDAMAGRKS